MSETGETNKETIRRLFAEVDRGNVEAAAGYYAPGYLDHTSAPLRRQETGREGLRRVFALFQEAFPDVRHTIEDLVSEGDRVVARVTTRATHTGQLFGHPPTGRAVTLTGITIFRIVDGLIAERWAEGASLLEQLGIAPPEPGATGAAGGRG
jgi:steroid delta-isomerase-like uncharacterized protein